MTISTALSRNRKLTRAYILGSFEPTYNLFSCSVLSFSSCEMLETPGSSEVDLESERVGHKHTLGLGTIQIETEGHIILVPTPSTDPNDRQCHIFLLLKTFDANFDTALNWSRASEQPVAPSTH